MNSCIGMRAGFLEVRSQQISWLPMFGNPATASRLSLIHLLKIAFVWSASFGHHFAMMLVHLVRPTPSKHWPMRLNSNGPLSICASKSWVKIFDLKSGSVYARKYSTPNQAWLGVKWLVNSLEVESLEFFSNEILIQSGCFRPSSISLSGLPLAPKDVQLVYQLNWGVFCALIRSDIITIFTCLELDHLWVLVMYLY